MSNDDSVYRELQKHLDKMPVGFPATESGVELRLLKTLFTPEQARIATGMDYKCRTVEQILAQLPGCGFSVAELEIKLEEMADRGNTFAKKQDGVKVYANMPLVVGMLELQVPRLSLSMLKDIEDYFQEKFAGEFLRTPVRQTRVIPIQKSITAGHRTGTYDELRDLIEKAEGRIRVGECMCRKGMQMANHTCAITTRKETCLSFRELADLMGRAGWGRPISKEEALEIAAKNEEDGLVLQPGNEQEIQFICSCCGDCCGILKTAKAMPKPSEFLTTNYYAQVDPEFCNGCSACVDRCQMDAVAVENDTAAINRDRCIGCGLCVSTCAVEAIELKNKPKEHIPPKDMEALLETIMAHK
ncbi:MAG TPA: 4Fe-4S binding protein [Acidobacteriota bacterium]|nr:4Fe-4S binding protein [Acidobacteriota bacterium]